MVKLAVRTKTSSNPPVPIHKQASFVARTPHVLLSLWTRIYFLPKSSPVPRLRSKLTHFLLILNMQNQPLKTLRCNLQPPCHLLCSCLCLQHAKGGLSHNLSQTSSLLCSLLPTHTLNLQIMTAYSHNARVQQNPSLHFASRRPRP